MEILKIWIMRLVGTALISAVALAVTPDGGVKKVLRLVCGFAVILAFISAFTEFDYISFASYLTEYKAAAEEITTSAQEKTSVETRLIIEERCAAYILDKAKEFGVEASASVKAVWSENGYWYPNEADIVFCGTDEAKEKLKNFIGAELGIAPDKQNWSEND